MTQAFLDSRHPPVKASKAADREQFFKVVFDKHLPIEEVVRFYQAYLGPLYLDQQRHFVARVMSSFEALSKNPRLNLLNSDGTLSREFLTHYFPTLLERCFSEGDIADFEKTELVKQTVNEFYDAKQPSPMNQRSALRKRPALALYARSGANVFVSPYGYAYFDPTRSLLWTFACARRYSTVLTTLPSREVGGVVVQVQDYGDGGNFAHFAFDWVPRILHVIKSGTCHRDQLYFLMGGQRSEFHDLFIRAICTKFGVSEQQFFFPEFKEQLLIKGTYLFFSDAKFEVAHPAHIAHPRTIALLKSVTASLELSNDGSEDRIFVSRGDAALRQIANETSLIEIAASYGFRPVRLSEMSATDQIRTFRRARYVVGGHGMGFTHLLFNRGALGILELFHPMMGTDAYLIMARSLGFYHQTLLGESISDNKSSYHVEPNQFEGALKELLQNG